MIPKILFKLKEIADTILQIGKKSKLSSSIRSPEPSEIGALNLKIKIILKWNLYKNV